jgi:2-C-methyl-D-erythritol 4-phosphate cytidylyltransferase
MSQFSVILLTAAPPGMPGAEPGAAMTKIDGREALLRAVELFLNREPIKQIQLCFLPDYAEEGKRKFGGHLGFSGVKVIAAGPKWTDQIAAAAEKLSADATHVVVHDAARCAVAFDDIDALLTAAEKSSACCLTAPLRAPLLELDDGGSATAVHSSTQFVQMLLPMCFSRARFDQLAKEKKEPHASEYTLLKGSSLNVRVSGAHDAALVKAMINQLPKPKIKAPSTPFDEAQW